MRSQDIGETWIESELQSGGERLLLIDDCCHPLVGSFLDEIDINPHILRIIGK